MSQKVLFVRIRKHLGYVIRGLARQTKSQVLEGHLCPDLVHVYWVMPPKHALAQVVGYIKGKSAIHIARAYGVRARHFTGEHFWASGYFVSTVSRDVEVIRSYIRKKEDEDRRFDQLELLR